MRIGDCGLRNGRQTALGGRQPVVYSALRTPHSAFTLIELLVAVGLMAILLTMIAVIFYEASQAFRVARASIEIHEGARSALNALLNDLTAASFTPYDTGVQGYFALSQGPTDPTTGATGASEACGLNWLGAWSNLTSYAVNDGVSYGGNSYICIAANTNQPPPNPKYWNVLVADTMTFTTLAPQPGARYAAPETVEQLALVRYALEWDGGNATLPGSSTPRPTYNLVKRVRFPCTADPYLNMDIFNWNLINPVTGLPYLQSEYTLHTSPPLPSNDPDVILDTAGLRYAQSEVIAFHVLSMNVRLFCLAQKQLTESSEVFLDSGFAYTGTASTLTDPAKTWPPNSFSGGGFTLRIIAGKDAGQALPIQSANGNVVTCSKTWNNSTPPDNSSQYRIEEVYVVTGTATSAGNNAPNCTLNDTTKNWPANSFTNSTTFPSSNADGFMLRIISGTGAGQAFPISSASGGTVTCLGTWSLVPDNTSQYRIEGLPSGTATGVGANTLTDSTQNWPAGSFSGGGFTLQIVGGTGAGQALPITSATGSIVTCSGTWNPALDTTSQYQIIEPLSWNLGWYQRGNYPGNYNFFGPTYRPPAIVEVTLEMTDSRATRSFFFTQRFYVPTSER